MLFNAKKTRTNLFVRCQAKDAFIIDWHKDLSVHYYIVWFEQMKGVPVSTC